MPTLDSTSHSFDSESLAFVGGADLCLFDSTGTTFDSTVRTFDATTCQEVTPEADAPVVRRGGGSRGRNRPRYWWEPEEEKQLPQPEVVAIAPVIIEPLPFVPRRPFAEPAKKINKRRAVMIAALLDE